MNQRAQELQLDLVDFDFDVGPVGCDVAKVELDLFDHVGRKVGIPGVLLEVVGDEVRLHVRDATRPS